LKYWSEQNFKEIGKGGFGVVWKGYNKHTHEEVTKDNEFIVDSS
jgi:hypothetical protein